MSNTLRVGVIGCGGIGNVHVGVLKKVPEVTLAAFCDIDSQKAEKLKIEHGVDVRIFDEYQKLIGDADIDAVHICTPHYLHADMAIAALRAGKYVLCEKPMDITKVKARAMIAADTCGRMGFVFQNRYNPASVRAKEIILSNEYGALQSMRAVVTWHRDAAYYASAAWRGKWATEGGGVLINQAIHTVDLLYHLGGAFSSVKGTISRDILHDEIEVEDNAHAVIRHESGITSLLYASNDFATDDMPEIKLFFEKGTFVLSTNALMRVEKDSVTPMPLQDSQAAGGGKAVYGNGHDAIIRDFYRAAIANKPFAVTPEEAYPAIWAVLSVYESSATDAWVHFDA